MLFDKYNIYRLFIPIQYNISQYQILVVDIIHTKMNFLQPLQPQPICPNDPESKYHQWCNFEAVDPISLIIQMVYMPFVLVIGVYTIFNYYKIIKLRKQPQYRSMLGNAYNWMHMIVIIWFICTTIRLLISIYVYYRFMYDDIQTGPDPEHPDPPTLTAQLVIWSQIYPFFRLGSVFAVNLLLWLVDFQFMKTLLINVIMNHNVTYSTRKTFSYILVGLKILFVYCKYIRNIIMILALIEPIIFFTTDIQTKCSFPSYNYYIATSESILILICYLLSFVVFRYILLSGYIKITSRQLRIIVLQYGTLFIALFLRVILNIVNISRIGYLMYKPNGNCTDVLSQNDEIQSVLLILHHFIMHMAPIIIILIIYRPVIKSSKSLIDEDYLRNSQTLVNDLRYDQLQKQFYQESLIGPGDLDSVSINEEVHYT